MGLSGVGGLAALGCFPSQSHFCDPQLDVRGCLEAPHLQSQFSKTCPRPLSETACAPVQATGRFKAAQAAVPLPCATAMPISPQSPSYPQALSPTGSKIAASRQVFEPLLGNFGPALLHLRFLHCCSEMIDSARAVENKVRLLAFPRVGIVVGYREFKPSGDSGRPTGKGSFEGRRAYLCMRVLHCRACQLLWHERM